MSLEDLPIVLLESILEFDDNLRFVFLCINRELRKLSASFERIYHRSSLVISISKRRSLDLIHNNAQLSFIVSIHNKTWTIAYDPNIRRFYLNARISDSAINAFIKYYYLTMRSADRHSDSDANAPLNQLSLHSMMRLYLPLYACQSISLNLEPIIEYGSIKVKMTEERLSPFAALQSLQIIDRYALLPNLLVWLSYYYKVHTYNASVADIRSRALSQHSLTLLYPRRVSNNAIFVMNSRFYTRLFDRIPLFHNITTLQFIRIAIDFVCHCENNSSDSDSDDNGSLHTVTIDDLFFVEKFPRLRNVILVEIALNYRQFCALLRHLNDTIATIALLGCDISNNSQPIKVTLPPKLQRFALTTSDERIDYIIDLSALQSPLQCLSVDFSVENMTAFFTNNIVGSETIHFQTLVIRYTNTYSGLDMFGGLTLDNDGTHNNTKPIWQMWDFLLLSSIEIQTYNDFIQNQIDDDTPLPFIDVSNREFTYDTLYLVIDAEDIFEWDDYCSDRELDLNSKNVVICDESDFHSSDMCFFR